MARYRNQRLLDNIKKIRKNTGLSQEAFYNQYIESLGLTDAKTGPGKQGYMKRLENGDNDFPIQLLPVYAKLGNCSIDSLIGYANSEKEDAGKAGYTYEEALFLHEKMFLAAWIEGLKCKSGLKEIRAAVVEADEAPES